EDIVTKTIAPVLLCDQTPATLAAGQPVTDGDTGRTRVVIGAGELAVQFELRAGILGVHADQTRERVGAIARSLRSPQYLDLLHIEQGRGHADTRKIDVVDQESHRRIRRSLVLLD